jgi:hypothetical protein
MRQVHERITQAACSPANRGPHFALGKIEAGGLVEIGEPERTYTVEPVEDPVPRESPAEPAEEPIAPTPTKEPIETEKVQAP